MELPAGNANILNKQAADNSTITLERVDFSVCTIQPPPADTMFRIKLFQSPSYTPRYLSTRIWCRNKRAGGETSLLCTAFVDGNLQCDFPEASTSRANVSMYTELRQCLENVFANAGTEHKHGAEPSTSQGRWTNYQNIWPGETKSQEKPADIWGGRNWCRSWARTKWKRRNIEWNFSRIWFSMLSQRFQWVSICVGVRSDAVTSAVETQGIRCRVAASKMAESWKKACASVVANSKTPP